MTLAEVPLIEKALGSAEIQGQRRQKLEVLRERASRVFEVASEPRYRESWRVYPFNSGYFMLVEVTGVLAERLRVHLLDKHGVGLIATGKHDLRIAGRTSSPPMRPSAIAASRRRRGFLFSRKPSSFSTDSSLS